MAEIWVTKEELEKRKERLEYMKTDRRLQIAEDLKFARSLGDLSENAEYDAAKDEQAKNEHDIEQLEKELENVKIIGVDDKDMDSKVISIGTTVKIEFVDLGMEQTYRIVGSAEADPDEGRISNESPIGMALLGKKARNVVEVHTPGGVQKVRIKSISK